MEETKFEMLTSILEDMEYENMRNSDLGGTIVRVIDRFDNYLDEEQKTKLADEFSSYDKVKRENKIKRKKITEDEDQGEMLRRFISSEQFDF